MTKTFIQMALGFAFVGLTACSSTTTSYPADYSRITDILREDVEAKRRGGYVVAIVDKDDIIFHDTVGFADPYNRIPFRMDTDVRIASMTKPIISVAIMQLVDQGRLSLDDPLIKYLPEFDGETVATDHAKSADGTYPGRAPLRPITIRHLLSHTSGIGYAFNARTDLDKDYIGVNPFSTTGRLEDRIKLIAKLPLYTDPGTEWRYSYATDILGRILEVVSGQSLDSYLEDAIFNPLGMDETRFFLDYDDLADLAVVNAFDETGTMIRSAGDALGPNVNDHPFTTTSGGAGLLSTMNDYIRFSQMLLNDGTLQGVQILKPQTVKLMMTPVASGDMMPKDGFSDMTGIGFGLGGFVIMEAHASPDPDAEGDWGWAGYWDTHFIISPKLERATILMAQTQPGPHMPPSNAWNRVKAVVYGETLTPEVTP